MGVAHLTRPFSVTGSAPGRSVPSRPGRALLALASFYMERFAHDSRRHRAAHSILDRFGSVTGRSSLWRAELPFREHHDDLVTHDGNVDTVNPEVEAGIGKARHRVPGTPPLQDLLRGYELRDLKPHAERLQQVSDLANVSGRPQSKVGRLSIRHRCLVAS